MSSDTGQPVTRLRSSVDTRLYATCASAFRSVLIEVRPEQLDNPTPCHPLNVAQLVEKAVGHRDWVRGALHGDSGAPEYPRIEPSKYLAAFDRSTQAMLTELACAGAMDRTVTLAAGLRFSGYDVMILASRNIFQFAWDLARGTHQSTNIAPDAARELLELSKTRLVPQRGPGGFFGPEISPPAGASAADVLAGYLGRAG